MKNLFLLFNILLYSSLFAQNAKIYGKIANSQTEAVPFANIYLENTNTGTSSDANGNYSIKNIEQGSYTIVVSAIGYQEKKVIIDVSKAITEINIELSKEDILFDQVVVTGTRTFKHKSSSPVFVNVLDVKSIEKVNACTVSEGLKFQPGLRVETDCQTCNYTQLRINGLSGSYSQILINGRPIFSALTGLYGLEQIPSTILDRIEVVKGGGSALYGSNAIGGTVNVITKIPKKNAYDVGLTYQNINSKSNESILNASGTIMNKKKNFGATLSYFNRFRQAYDHNKDNFSELPKIKNNAIDANFIYKPTENQKLSVSTSYINEYRYGGEMIDKELYAHLALQSEERTHNVFMGSIDYQYNFKNFNSSLIAYSAGQYTDRQHFTGIQPDEGLELTDYLKNPPYGTSKTYTINGGVQFNHRIDKFITLSNIITTGVEYVHEDVFDEILAYNYLVDQTAKNVGTYIQSDWEVFKNFNLLSGLRMDKTNFIDKPIFSPRFSVMYKLKKTTQFRASWGTGFRAPQAFDTDMHIAFAGGGVSRVQLSPSLQQEKAHSVSASINFDKALEDFIGGFTISGFYTKLKDAFYLYPLGEDVYGELFEKRNGSGAQVAGGSIELRANYKRKLQIEAGVTAQLSKFDEAVLYIDGLAPTRNFLRTPNVYGFSILSIMPYEQLSINFSSLYTGKMKIAHYAGAPGVEYDSFVTSNPFVELNFKTSYNFELKKLGDLVLFGGINNILNSYQDDFDTGKDRDSNFVYGPSTPRTYFIGVRIKSH